MTPWVGKLLCALGRHNGRLVKDDGHRYYQCRRCKLRYVIKQRDNMKWINQAWLDGGPFRAGRKKRKDEGRK